MAMKFTAPTLFFTGKGGVGKTSTACAVAVSLADAGRRVLLVCTDPASNLSEVLEAEIPVDVATQLAAVSGLDVLEIDPEAAACTYRERVVGPYRGVLPDATVANIEEQLSGACTMELAAFDQFARLLGEEQKTAAYDHLVFDTAPTGHTLRLLELPAAWTGFFDTNTSGTSCLGPLKGLEAERQVYAKALDALRDGTRTEVVLVTRPEVSAVLEAERSARELRALGIERHRLIVNGVFKTSGNDDEIARAFEARANEALAALPEGLSELPRVTLPLFASAPLGISGLRKLARAIEGDDCEQATEEKSTPASSVSSWDTASWKTLVDELAAPGCGVILTMGKGGVGKTTLAVRIAMDLARRGERVHLTTTDPAAHLLEVASGEFPSLRVSRIDPELETQNYREQVLAAAGKGLDEKGLALLEEDLLSPCTEEIAVFQAFARTVGGGREEFVVIDTAPTGHTLLLLDAAEAYHREVLRKPGESSEEVKQLLPRLRDPEFTRVLLVTLPEATPVHEAEALARDLARAGIQPFGWLVNQSLWPLTPLNAVLCARRNAEARFIAEVAKNTNRLVLMPWKEAPLYSD